MKTDETNPDHWFLLAGERLKAADTLYQGVGACYSAVELLQEAVERYLKGYLVAHGWALRRVHNLSALLDAAVARDSRFMAYADLCEQLTAQFWAQHYPGGDLAEVGADYAQLRRQAGEMIKLVRGQKPSNDL